MVRIHTVLLKDPVPSARHLTGTVRHVLWGIVELVSRNKDTTSSCLVNKDDREDSSEARESKREDDYFDSSVEESKELLRQQLDQWRIINSTATTVEDDDIDNQLPLSFGSSNSRKNRENRDSNIPDYNIDNELPLSFGSSKNKENDDGCVPDDDPDNEVPSSFGGSSHSKKKGGKRKKKSNRNRELKKMKDMNLNSPAYSYTDYELPANFRWKVMLPFYSDEYTMMESNVYTLQYNKFVKVNDINCIFLPGDNLEHPDNLYPVRVLGCGPSSCSTGGNNIIRTSIVQYIGYEDVYSLEVSRSSLQPVAVEQEDFIRGQLGYQLFDRQDSPLGDEKLLHPDVHSKYWDQRYRLFSLFDRGIDLDAESWYSVTPEIIAKHIAQRCIGSNSSITNKKRNGKGGNHTTGSVLDLFCGCGGNAIPLASVFQHVTAVDINPVKLPAAKLNAKAYGVQDKIDFVCADAYDILYALGEPPLETAISSPTSPETYSEPVDAVLLAPPWGGPGYTDNVYFNMKTDFPSGDGFELIKLAAKFCPNIICVFPKNMDKHQIDELVEVIGLKCVVEEIFLYTKHKLSVLYFGPMFCDLLNKKEEEKK